MSDLIPDKNIIPFPKAIELLLKLIDQDALANKSPKEILYTFGNFTASLVLLLEKMPDIDKLGTFHLLELRSILLSILDNAKWLVVVKQNTNIFNEKEQELSELIVAELKEIIQDLDVIMSESSYHSVVNIYRSQKRIERLLKLGTRTTDPLIINEILNRLENFAAKVRENSNTYTLIPKLALADIISLYDRFIISWRQMSIEHQKAAENLLRIRQTLALV